MRESLQTESLRACWIWRVSLSVAVFFASLAVKESVFQGLPRVTDETSHWFQAQLLAAGQWYVELPPCPASFFQHNVVMTKDGRWFGKYPPGHTLWLALGMRLGVVGIMVPFASAVGLFPFMAIVRRFYSESLSRLSGIGWLLSPQVLLLAGSYMSHTTALTTCLLAVWFTIRMWDSKKAPITFFYGIGSGFMWMASLINRPQDAFIAGLWFGILALCYGRPFGRWPRMILGIIIGALPLFSVMAYRNYVLFGSVFSLGYYPSEDLLLFPLISGSFGFNEQHTVSIATQYFVWSMYRMNRALLGWPISFVFLPFLLFDCRFRLPDFWAAGLIFLTICFFALHSYYGFEYEARYYLLAVPSLLVLTSRGIVICWNAGKVSRFARSGTIFIVVISLIYSVFFYWGILVPRVYGHNYEQVDLELHRRAQIYSTDLLVLVPSGNIHRDFRYSSGFIFTDPWLSSPIIYARDIDDQFECLKYHFPNRTLVRAWHNDGMWELEVIPNLDD